jgi:hypothetical protein
VALSLIACLRAAGVDADVDGVHVPPAGGARPAPPRPDDSGRPTSGVPVRS